jgi:hypothetical protein
MRCSILDFISRWFIYLCMKSAKYVSERTGQPRGQCLRNKLEAELHKLGARSPEFIPTRQMRNGLSLWDYFENVSNGRAN